MARRWREEGPILLPPETETAVRSTFARVGSVATADVISMYSILGGMEEMDKEYWRLWPLSEVLTENTERSDHGVMFADYLINCWNYKLLPNANNTSSVFADYFDTKGPTLVATSIDEFFRVYAADPFRVLEGPYPIGLTNGDA